MASQLMAVGPEDTHLHTKACVYTVLFGDYERLSAQPVAKSSALPFICFTDNPQLKSDCWTIKVVEPLFKSDPVRSSRYLKICAHRALPQFALSLYIDNSVLLTELPENIFRSLLLSQNNNLACLQHSYRKTVAAEFSEVHALDLDEDATIFRQFREYQSRGFNFDETPIWGGFLLRRHNMPDVVSCMEDWISNVLMYSRRDQLAFNYVAWRTGLSYTAHKLDNFESRYHRWPSMLDRNNELNNEGLDELNMPALMQLARRTLDAEQLKAGLKQQTAQAERLQSELKQQTAEAERLQEELTRRTADIERLDFELVRQATENAKLTNLLAIERTRVANFQASTSWRMTEPLRTIVRFLARFVPAR